MQLPWRRRKRTEPVTIEAPARPSVDIDHLPDWLAGLVPGAPRLNETVQALGELLRRVPTSALPRLDVAARSWTRWDDDSYRRLTPADVEDIISVTGDALAVAAATSMHRSGYVREAAVRLLSAISTGEELRWLLLRCTDWVPEVRSVALAAVRERCLDPHDRARYTDELAASAVLLESERFRADDAVEVRGELREALLATGSREALRAAARNPDHGTRRAAVRLLAHAEPTVDLLRAQLSRGDVVAASIVADALLAEPKTCGEAANMLVASSIARFRELGLWHLAHDEHDAASAVDAALLDRAPGVRGLAQRLARDRLDLRDWYRERVSLAPEGALLGLADVGTDLDLATASRYLDSEPARVRAAAVRLLSRLGGRDALPRLLAIATSDTGRVAREAIGGIRRHGVTDDVATMAWEQVASEGASSPTRRRIFTLLLPLASRWTAAELGLRSLASADEELQELGARLLARTAQTWNRSWTRPTDSQLAKLSSLLDDVPGPRWPPRLRDEFRDIVRTWRSSK